jgi:hypothetical protein
MGAELMAQNPEITDRGTRHGKDMQSRDRNNSPPNSGATSQTMPTDRNPRSQHISSFFGALTTRVRENLPLIAFITSLTILAYAWGATTAYFRLFPHNVVGKSFRETQDFLKHWKNDLGLEPTRYLVEARGPTRHPGGMQPNEAMPGLRVVAGYFHNQPSQNGAILVDEQGTELHFWPIDHETIAASVEGAFADARNGFLHGFDVLADGSVIVSFDDANVLARLDACGEVIWGITGGYHHALSLAGDGTLWTVGGPGSELKPTAISRVNPEDGTVLETTNFDHDVLGGIGRGVFFIRTEDDPFGPRWLPDPFHLNDVEILDESIADAFPLFEAGDIMLSMRSLNLIVVIDADSMRIKWWQHGPWHRQHDPDFLPNGKISVFDNNMHEDASRIIEIDPVTRETEVVFEGSAQLPFYTWIRGKHQHLDNGNILIVESSAGRVLEVDRSGRLVWEYQNRFDEDQNLLVSNAIWIPRNFFEPDALKCNDATADVPASALESPTAPKEDG